mmetsp:Transcript_37118/g.89519  ORF Transcript_37118/g.89519 Transcript_37118/m.89519 type:complete len:127 (-) Transcript_37118:111-491(-)
MRQYPFSSKGGDGCLELPTGDPTLELWSWASCTPIGSRCADELTPPYLMTGRCVLDCGGDNGEDGIAAVVAGRVCLTCLVNLSIDLLASCLRCCSVVALQDDSFSTLLLLLEQVDHLPCHYDRPHS